MEIQVLSSKYEEDYKRLITEGENTLLLSTLKYRNLLKWITKSEPYYLIALEENKIVGCLPTFLKRNSTYGNVLNSLPWFGGNPGILVSAVKNHSDKKHIKNELIKAFHKLAKEHDCISSTLVSRPFEEDLKLYETNMNHTFLDSRIGMFTPLPKFSKTIDKDLMDIIHSKTRNLIRKAQKSGITYYHNNNIDSLKFLAEVHKQNMVAVGAPPKELDFFIKISEIFEYDKDYRIYIAELDGVKIGSLLLIYFNKTVEYFTPAVKVEYRNIQPLNLLIFNAMKDMSEKGYKYWNWGGTTLPGMEGVYHFKKRWGSDECNYYYYTTFYKSLDIIRSLNSEVLLNEYPYFYVIPFFKLKKEELI